MTRGSDALTPEEAVVTLLRETNMTLSTAESCTGGAIAARIVNVPGASDVFMEGMVTYSNGAKKRTLGVTEDTLRDLELFLNSARKRWRKAAAFMPVRTFVFL